MSTFFQSLPGDLNRRHQRPGVSDGIAPFRNHRRPYRLYRINRLVYFEETTDITAAIAREKQIKGWRRSKKVQLIESLNPTWEDLADIVFKAPAAADQA